MEYAFHCESAKAPQLRSDIELIPAIGFTSDRTGSSSVKALENEMQLSRINNKNTDDYIAVDCPEEKKITVSKTQKPTEYGYSKETYGYSEVDKEQASIQNSRPAEYSYEGEPVTVNCSELMGEGYHVVQKGENLRAIARTYGVDVASLVKWNNIKDPNKIEICQIIWYQKPTPNQAKTAKIAPKTAPAPKPENTVIDQRKLVKPNTTKKPQPYSTEDEDYDSWRQKPQTTPKSPQKPQEYEYYDDDKLNSDRPLVHTIKKGEYLYKIAKMYDCPEECIRRANDYPETGDVAFSIGQKVIIPVCDCLEQKPRFSPKNAPYETPYNTNTDKKKEKMNGNALTKPEQYDYNDEKSKEGVADPNRKVKEDEWSVLSDETQKSSTASKSSAKKNSTDPKVQQFREHLVRQGDNLRSVATKYKVDPSELAHVNGIGLSEELTPGKWILVPISE
ncbi:MAG: LysM peptidoglycan-binding domain-containing protein [Saprospiraceae bacterium]|nr:LysM peptidoglycan-binding domain-containing protein [Saprospiraceae bacterium]